MSREASEPKKAADTALDLSDFIMEGRGRSYRTGRRKKLSIPYYSRTLSTKNFEFNCVLHAINLNAMKRIPELLIRVWIKRPCFDAIRLPSTNHAIPLRVRDRMDA